MDHRARRNRGLPFPSLFKEMELLSDAFLPAPRALPRAVLPGWPRPVPVHTHRRQSRGLCLCTSPRGRAEVGSRPGASGWRGEPSTACSILTASHEWCLRCVGEKEPVGGRLAHSAGSQARVLATRWGKAPGSLSAMWSPHSWCINRTPVTDRRLI